MSLLDDLNRDYAAKRSAEAEALSKSGVTARAATMLLTTLMQQVESDIKKYAKIAPLVDYGPAVDYVPRTPNGFTVSRKTYPMFAVDVSMPTLQAIRICHVTKADNFANSVEVIDRFDIIAGGNGQACLSHRGKILTITDAISELLYRHLKP